MLKIKSFALAGIIMLTMGLAGCSDNPGKWSQEKVEAKVRESLHLSEITLIPAPESGVLTGSGKDASGETFKLKVTQDADAKRISWDAQGDRGASEVGSFELQ